MSKKDHKEPNTHRCYLCGSRRAESHFRLAYVQKQGGDLKEVRVCNRDIFKCLRKANRTKRGAESLIWEQEAIKYYV